jgi:hypothetical protein
MALAHREPLAVLLDQDGGADTQQGLDDLAS